MRGNVISYRLTDAELEALQAFQIPEDKSPSQTAARLLRGMLAGIIELSTVSSTPVDLKSLIKQEVAASFSKVRSQLEAQLEAQLETRLEELRGKLKAR